MQLINAVLSMSQNLTSVVFLDNSYKILRRSDSHLWDIVPDLDQGPMSIDNIIMAYIYKGRNILPRPEDADATYQAITSGIRDANEDGFLWNISANLSNDVIIYDELHYHQKIEFSNICKISPCNSTGEIDRNSNISQTLLSSLMNIVKIRNSFIKGLPYIGIDLEHILQTEFKLENNDIYLYVDGTKYGKCENITDKGRIIFGRMNSYAQYI